MNAIERAATLLAAWAEQVDREHAAPGTVEAMRSVAAEARAEFNRLRRSPGAALDAMIKAWAARELDRLPSGPRGEWIRTGVIPRAIKLELAGVPEPVAALIGAHVADEMGECEICSRRAACRLISDGTLNGEATWRCGWGCPAPPDVDPVAARATSRQ